MAFWLAFLCTALPEQQSLILRADAPEAIADLTAQPLGGPFYRVEHDGTAMNELRSRESVQWVIPEARRRVLLDQAAPFTDLQWHLDNDGSHADLWPQIEAGADINITDAWTTTVGNGDVVIAVLDTGIATDHPDLPLASRLPGWDFVDDDDDPSPVGHQPNAAHGTLVAALALGAQNGSGVVGVCPGCTLLPIRVLAPDDTVRDGDVVAAILWAAERADVINASWSFDPLSYVSPAVHDAIRWATEHGRNGRGTVVVFSAGNRAGEIDDFAPEAMSETITVGATDERDNRAGYSNHGLCLSLMAPGGGPDQWNDGGRVARAKLVTADLIGPLGYNPAKDEVYAPGVMVDPDYTAAFWGTSAATPLVSGVAALLRSIQPGLRPNEIGWILTETAAEIGGETYIEGFNELYGHGRLDAGAAVAMTVSSDHCTASIEICDNSDDDDCDRLVDAGDYDCGAQVPRTFTVPLGQPCTGIDDCGDGYCSNPDGSEATRFCTADCDYDCPAGGTCVGVGANSSCYVGCGGETECPTGTRCVLPDLTVVPPGQTSRACLATCDSDRDCSMLQCEQGVCAGVAQLRPSSPRESGCDCHVQPSSLPTVFCLLVFWWCRRRLARIP